MKGKTVFLATDTDNKETIRPWLEDAIEEYVKNNSNKDSVDIVEHFKLSADITLSSLSQLTTEGRVVRKHLFGSNYSYTI